MPILRSGLWAISLGCAFSACSGELTAPVGPGGVDGDTPASPITSAEGSGSFARGEYDPKLCEDRELSPGAMPQLVRLTHLQYQNAITDLLGLDAGAKDFVPDQVFFGFNTNAEKLNVDETQTNRYRSAAERIAENAAKDLSHIAKTVPCVMTTPDEACRDQFLSEFLELLLRRPLNEELLTRYRNLFDAGADLFEDDSDAFTRGVRVTLEAALQTPSFLYRAELRSGELDGKVVALDSYEVASRLALTLWGSVPDRALLDKAKADGLLTADEVKAEARRMLDDPRAARVLDDFHAQWLELDKLHFGKDPLTFPDYDEDAFSTAAKADLLSFTREVALAQSGVISELFSATPSEVDPALGDTLSPNERPGILTQPGFLAGRADALDGSPIHRGAYIQKRLLCRVFGALPANVGMLPPRDEEIVTTRDQVEAKTGAPECQFCHKDINPAGFAFEHFDTLGRYRTEDHGEAVDAYGTLTLDGKEHSFDGATELSDVLADSPTARRCYETQWFRYALGRAEVDDDVCLLHAIDQEAKGEGYEIKALLIALAGSRGFRFRTMEDL